MAVPNEVELEILHRLPGRAVLAQADGIHLGHNYDVLRLAPDGSGCTRVTSFPRSPLRRMAEHSRLACRLARQEVRALVRLADGSYVGANREGVFRGREGDAVMAPCEVASETLPLQPPLRIELGPDETVVFGEYGFDRSRAMRLFASRDGGRHFQVVHRFPAGEILHVHNVRWDASAGHYWVLAGDHDHEPGFARLSADFERLEWVAKGRQEARAVDCFDLGDRLAYATDTEKAVNGAITLDKQSGALTRHRDFEGSGIYACRFGGLLAISTSVEPSEVNHATWASLYLSRDGVQWKRAFSAEKDRWHPHWFQFGSIVLPKGASETERLVFSGQALRGIDGVTLVARLAGGAEV
ncbi:MAG: hypothetical protein QNK03_10810 [Myxococcota bacterium]|nr:hypothetical protein [Myxococcota bacterium]